MKRLVSVIAICLLVSMNIPFLPLIPVFAQTPQEPTTPILGVHWHHRDNTTNHVFDGSGEEWLFGETIKLVVTDENGTNIADKDYEVSRCELVNFSLIIPTHFFDGNRELEHATVGANMGNETISADLHLQYFAPRDEWYAFSSLYDMNTPDPPKSNAFFNFDESSSGIVTVGENILVNFIGTFNMSAPRGVYNTWAEAMDNKNNFIHPGFFSYGMGDEFPLPPIALDCTLDYMMHTIGKLPEYNMRVLDASHQPIQYAEAGDTVIFELTMDTEVGFTAFDLGPIADYGEQHQYFENVTHWWPDDCCNPHTTWTMNTWEEAPHLGFYYNASAAPPNDIGAFIFYPNDTYVWRDYGAGTGCWECLPDPIIANTSLLPLFYNFNQALSGAQDPYTIIWKGSFTNLVFNRTDWTHSPPKVTYGHTFQIWAHNPRFWGTQNTEGIFAEPSFDFIQNNGVVLALNSFFIQAWIQDALASEPLNHVELGDWFTISMDIHAPIEEIKYTTGPYLADPVFNIWHNDTVDLKNMTFWLHGYSNGWNDTHSWNTDISIFFQIDIESLAPINQFCEIRNSTWLTYDWSLVDETFSNTTTGLANLLEISNVVFTPDVEYTLFEFDAKFLPEAPDGDYHVWDVIAERNMIHQNNATGIWETFEFTDYYYLWSYTHWVPPSLTLGDFLVWVPDLWTVTEDGALDLDGNLATTDDQYFVKRINYWHDEMTRHENSLHVGIMFDPTAQQNWHPNGDEFFSGNWMGLMTESLTYTWNESFYWYYTNMTLVNGVDMDAIRDLVWQDINEQIPAPGYNMIAWMTVNRSWDDLLNEWWWLEDNTWEWSWFGFGTEQDFNLATDVDSTTWARFRSEFAGLLLFIDNTTINGGNGVPDFEVTDGFVDTDEVTHFFLIDNVDRVEFTYPFNSLEETGEEILIIHSAFDEVIDFGVRIFDVTGTLYPIHTGAGAGIKGCWDYYGSAESLVGLNASAFDHILSTATIDEMAFDIHYTVYLPNSTQNPDPNNNLVSIKVDQYIGDWTLHQFNNRVLEGRGLGIAYFGELSTSTFAEFKVDEEQVSGNNAGSQIGDLYQFGAEGRTFASVQMGSQIYEWGYDDQIYECGATTVPIGAFSAMFLTASGTSVCSYGFEGQLYFMVSGFTHWDGYSINNDPSFGIYTSALNMIVGPPPGADPFDMLMGILFVGITILIIVIIVVVMNIRRRGKGTTKSTREPVDDYWARR
jgi:hypothetical protein